MKYKVLLIDDEHDKASLSTIKRLANAFDIEFISEKYHESGMDVLKRDSNYQIQAVVLDAKGFRKDDNTGGSELDYKGLFASLNRLKEMRTDRIIPWFIYSATIEGQETLIQQVEILQEGLKFGSNDSCYYQKTEDEEQLLEDIVCEIEKINDTATEFRFKKVFDACETINLNPDLRKQLRDTLQLVEKNSFEKTYNIEKFAPLRLCCESIFKHASKKNILHSKCVDDKEKVNLFESLQFLRGLKTSHSKVKCSISHLPNILSANLENLIHITGAAAHTSSEEENFILNYDNYTKLINSPYLLNMVAYIVCDLYIWYDEYLKYNNDPEKNKALWMGGENSDIVGYLCQDNKNNYYFSDYKFNYTTIEQGYKIGDKLQIFKFKENSKYDKVNEPYLYFVIEFEKIKY